MEGMSPHNIAMHQLEFVEPHRLTDILGCIAGIKQFSRSQEQLVAGDQLVHCLLMLSSRNLFTPRMSDFYT